MSTGVVIVKREGGRTGGSEGQECRGVMSHRISLSPLP